MKAKDKSGSVSLYSHKGTRLACRRYGSKAHRAFIIAEWTHAYEGLTRKSNPYYYEITPDIKNEYSYEFN